MSNLRDVIWQMGEEGSQDFSNKLISGKGDKFSKLFSLLSNRKLTDEEVVEKMSIKPGAYYTLCSRLSDKLEKFLAKSIPEAGNADHIKSLNNIPHLVYSTPRETAIAQLLGMEKEFLKYDNPHFMAVIYHSLKRLTRYSSRYFDYEQKYNKNLAYTVAIHKAEEILGDFSKALGEYYLSRNSDQLVVLTLIKNKMLSNARLYVSHHLKVFENLLNVQYSLFVPQLEKGDGVVSVEDLLEEIETIFTSYSKEPVYGYLRNILNFLWFEYYRKHGIEKKMQQYFLRINENAASFLQNNFVGSPSLYLISLTGLSVEKKQEQKLTEYYSAIAEKFTPNKEDVAGYVGFIKFRAIASYYSGKYSESAGLLNELIKEVNFIPFLHAEIELKLFLSLNMLLSAKHSMAEMLLRNVQRKLRDMKNADYGHAAIFSKMLSMPLGVNDKSVFPKMISLRNRFIELNNGNMKMFGFLRLDDDLIRRLSKSVK